MGSRPGSRTERWVNMLDRLLKLLGAAKDAASGWTLLGHPVKVLLVVLIGCTLVLRLLRVLITAL